jgi:hypothetical protein
MLNQRRCNSANANSPLARARRQPAPVGLAAHRGLGDHRFFASPASAYGYSGTCRSCTVNKLVKITDTRGLEMERLHSARTKDNIADSRLELCVSGDPYVESILRVSLQNGSYWFISAWFEYHLRKHISSDKTGEILERCLEWCKSHCGDNDIEFFLHQLKQKFHPDIIRRRSSFLRFCGTQNRYKNHIIRILPKRLRP